MTPSRALSELLLTFTTDDWRAVPRERAQIALSLANLDYATNPSPETARRVAHDALVALEKELSVEPAAPAASPAPPPRRPQGKSAPPSPPSPEPPDSIAAEAAVADPLCEIVFPTREGDWTIPLMGADALRMNFPGLDLPAQFLAARSWLQQKPGNLKTKRGMPAFIGNWMRGAVGRARASVTTTTSEAQARAILGEGAAP